MLLPKKITAASAVVLSLTFFQSNALAGLYGFNQANPATHEEHILDIDIPPLHIVNYREKMRKNVNMLIDYAKMKNKDFQVMVHEGEDLLNKNLWEYDLEGYNRARRKKINAKDPTFLSKRGISFPKPEYGTSAYEYVHNINAVVLNNVFCSNRKVDENINKLHLQTISIDQCQTEEDFDEAIQESIGNHTILYGFTHLKNAFNTPHRVIINENARNIYNTQEASNILFLTDDSKYKDRNVMIEDLRNSNFDIVVIDPFFQHKKPFTRDEIDSLKFKKNGTKRLIIAEVNVSEARTDDYYWNKKWKVGNPQWLKRASFVDKNGVIVEYWQDPWKKIISSYFKDIIETGFDGAFLTGLENHKYFEQQTPLD